MEMNLFDSLQAQVEEAKKSAQSRNIALEVSRYEVVDGEMCVFGQDLITGQETRVSLYEDQGASTRKYARTSLTVRAGLEGDPRRAVKEGGVLILERAFEQPDSTDDLVVAKAGWTHSGTVDFDDGIYFSKFMTVQLIPGRHGKPASAFVEWVSNDEENTTTCKNFEAFKQGVEKLIVDASASSIRPHVHVRVIDTLNNKTIVLADLVRNNGNAANKFARESVGSFMTRAFSDGDKGDRFVKIVKGFFEKAGGELPDQYKLELLRGGSIPMTNNAKARLFDNKAQIPSLTPEGRKPQGMVLKELFSVGHEGARDTPMFTQGHIALKSSRNEEGAYFLSYANPVKNYAEFVELKDIPSVNYQPTPSSVLVKDATMEAEDPDDELNASASEMAEIMQSVDQTVQKAQSMSA